MGSHKQKKHERDRARFERRRKSRRPDIVAGWASPPAEAKWLSQAPVAEPGELAEDLAVFDAKTRADLPEPMRVEAELVREALDLHAEGDSATALERVAGIGRKSPYSDWRLLLRGLAPFQHGDLAAASDAWKRIAPDRRPGRIAAALTEGWLKMAAPASNLTARSAVLELMRRASMMATANEIMTVRHHDPKQLVSASQAALVIRFEKQYRSLDPDFVSMFTAACRELAFEQPDVPTFSALCAETTGPSDDPRSNRLRFLYLGTFIDAERERVQVAREYIDRDLPRLSHIPASLRAAMASVMLEQAAASFLDQEKTFGGAAFISSDDIGRAERLLREAIDRYPRNRLAHQALIDLLESEPGRDTPHADESPSLLAAKEACLAIFPDHCEYLLDVIGHCIDHGDFVRAEPLVRGMADKRFEGLDAQAMPWRFELERATWLARKNGATPDLRIALETALTCWPKSLSRQWIPFLESALLLSEGNHASFETAVAAARVGCQEGLLADAMLADALERFHVAEPEIDRAWLLVVRGASDIGIDGPIEPLIATACFLNDLEQRGLSFSASRSSSKLIGTALCRRLEGAAKWKLSSLLGDGGRLPEDDPAFWTAFEWIAEHDFFGTVKATREPRWIGKPADTHPRAAAATLDWLERTAPEKLLGRRNQKRLALVEKAATIEPDPTMRERLSEIVREVTATIAAEEHAKQFKRRGGRRNRKLPSPEEVARMSPATLPRFLQLILERGGPDAVVEAVKLFSGPQTPGSADRLADFANRLGITPMEMIEAMMADT